MLVIIIGYPCTGKTTLREHLERNHILAIEASTFIKPLKKECQKEGISDVYTKYPKYIVAELITQKYGHLLRNAVVVGLRTVDEIEYFQQRYTVKLLALTASLDTCFMRCNERLNREHFESKELFLQNRILPDERLGLRTLYDNAEDIILNDGVSEDHFLNYAFGVIAKYIEK